MNLVVMVGSAGCLRPLTTILGALPPDLNAAVVVVMHRSANRRSYLREILARATRLPVVNSLDGARLTAGRVYVAPQGEAHVSIDADTIRMVPGAKVHWHRPAGDPLFESAARSFGRHCLGVVLSGMGRNGEAGLTAIKRAGGRTFVQDPHEAEYPSMPLHALGAVEPDFCGSAAGIGQRLIDSCRARTREVQEQVAARRTK